MYACWNKYAELGTIGYIILQAVDPGPPLDALRNTDYAEVIYSHTYLWWRVGIHDVNAKWYFQEQIYN